VRGLLLLAVLALVVVALWSLRGAWRPQSGRPPLAHDRLVKDPVCRTYVVSARAVQREIGGAVHYFCSRECADRYARSVGRGGAGPAADDLRGEGRS
jgi:YHS domain-containing protein